MPAHGSPNGNVWYRGLNSAGVNGAAWAASLPELRTFVTANYNQPNPHNQSAMASPPTITTQTSTPAAFTRYYSHTDSPGVIAYGGGGNYVNAGLARQFPAATRGTSSGNITGGVDGVVWRARTMANAADVGIRIGGSASLVYRFIVDGKYVDTTGTLSAQSGTNRYYTLAFGSKANRLIEIEGEQHLAFFGFATGASDECTAPTPATRRMIVLGDSITIGTGATRQEDGFARVAGDQLGIYDTWCSGVSGTGYMATNGGTPRYKLSERLGDVNTTGPWDVIVVAMGINDRPFAASDITAEVLLCLGSIRASNPSAQIFVVGPWDSAAPSAPASDYTACRAAIIAGIPSGVGITFIDAQGVQYTKADTIHPNTAGHLTLGNWLALQIKTALGA